MTQAEALKIMKSGVNVYLSGSAGSGKTYTLNRYIEWLHDHNVGVAITASTGIAATHIGGMTIHGFAGIGIRQYLSDYDLEALLEKPYLAKRFETTQVLIIDEVSMLHANTLDMVDQVARAFRRNDKPFGGIQVILCGDFFQLPPITKILPGSLEDESTEAPKDFIFYSKVWQTMRPAICYLTEQYRQSDDGFTNILNQIRRGDVPDESLALLGDRLGAELPLGLRPTKLYTHNVDVDAINFGELMELPGEEKKFDMYSKGRANLVEILKKGCLATETLRLKVGAEVMFIKNNQEKNYVNGTRGVISDFSRSGAPIVRLANGREIEVEVDSWLIEENGKIKAEITQYPIRLAWAITIHKSQGLSLDYAEIDLSKTFAYGMGYVALSRLRTLEGLRLVGFEPRSLEVDPRILELDESLQKESEENAKLFEKLPDAEYQKLVNDFIIRSGGTIAKKPAFAKGFGRAREKVPTTTITKNFIQEGKSLEEIAKERDMVIGTIISHLEQLCDAGELEDIDHLRPPEKYVELVKKFLPKSEGRLSPLKSALKRSGHDLSFEEIRLARIFAKRSSP